MSNDGEKKDGKLNADPFSYLDIYPDIEKIIQTNRDKGKDLKENGIFVLDTNVLLLPYDLDTHTLQSIGSIYSSLHAEGRLFIPGQVVREFAANRPGKIENSYSKIVPLSTKELKFVSNAMLGDDPDYQDIKALERDIKEKIREYNSKLDSIKNTIINWDWSDPVSTIYQEFFKISTVDIPIDRKDLIKEAASRKANLIPPGYKDFSKSINPYGDLIIWKTIIHIGKTYDRPVVFVTNDSKPDWWVISNSVLLYPRYELVYEFRKETGHEFYMIKLSDLMKTFHAEKKEISLVRESESKLDSLNLFDISNIHTSIAIDSVKSMLSREGKVTEIDFDTFRLESDRSYLVTVAFFRQFIEEEDINEIMLNHIKDFYHIQRTMADSGDELVCIIYFPSEEAVGAFKYAKKFDFPFPTIIGVFVRPDQPVFDYIESGAENLPDSLRRVFG